MSLPPQYAWLSKEPAPKILIEGLKLYGIKEKAGKGINNPVIMQWARVIGVPYEGDHVPWCGLYMAYVAFMAGKPIPRQPLWALNWGAWGKKSDKPMLGDVLCFMRDSGGHVGIYVGEDTKAYHVLGGNQGDAVSIVRIDKGRMRHARRTIWQIKQPANVGRVFLSPQGAISHNEA